MTNSVTASPKVHGSLESPVGGRQEEHGHTAVWPPEHSCPVDPGYIPGQAADGGILHHHTNFLSGVS